MAGEWPRNNTVEKRIKVFISGELACMKVCRT